VDWETRGSTDATYQLQEVRVQPRSLRGVFLLIHNCIHREGERDLT